MKSKILQTTINRPISCFGIGVHSAKKVQLTLKPAQDDTGIVFIRTDVKLHTNHILAHYSNVSDTSLSTKISNDANICVSTIEHLMAALWGCGVDNAIIELDGEEVPIMDGSSKPFVFMIECVGIKELSAKRRTLKILKDISCYNGESEVLLSPSDEFTAHIAIEYKSKAIGKQEFAYKASESFKDLVADARTFGFAHELDYLRSKGLAQGASLENAIGIDHDIIMNDNGLRFDDEFARHKLLDALGDVFTSGCHVIGRLDAYKTGHATNNLVLHKLFSMPDSYCWI